MFKIEVLNNIENVIKLLDELEDYKNELPSKQSNVDQRISDIYHYIETNSITTKKSYRLIKKLKNVLLERRIYKEDRSLLDTFENNKGRLNLKSNRSLLLNDIKREDKQLKNTYKYRIYDENEFIKMIEE